MSEKEIITSKKGIRFEKTIIGTATFTDLELAEKYKYGGIRTDFNTKELYCLKHLGMTPEEKEERKKARMKKTEERRAKKREERKKKSTVKKLLRKEISALKRIARKTLDKADINKVHEAEEKLLKLK